MALPRALEPLDAASIESLRFVDFLREIEIEFARVFALPARFLVQHDARAPRLVSRLAALKRGSDSVTFRFSSLCSELSCEP
jgi:hypothetical protein